MSGGGALSLVDANGALSLVDAKWKGGRVQWQ